MREAVLTIVGTILVVLTVCLIAACMTGATFAQSIGDRPVTFPEHSQHAAYVILPYGGSTSVAQGEQTSNFPSPALPISLGEVARRNKVEHKSVPKSKCVWEGQCRISKIDCLSR
jgi:hypothetical protein